MELSAELPALAAFSVGNKMTTLIFPSLEKLSTKSIHDGGSVPVVLHN